MPLYQEAQIVVYIDPSLTPVLPSGVSILYRVDTSKGDFLLILPAGIPVQQVVTVQNFPAGGPQVGGTVVGGNVTVQTTSPETFDDGSTSQVLGPPVSPITAATRTYMPTGTGSQAGYNGWMH